MEIGKKQRKENMGMKSTFKGTARRWFVVGGLLLLMSITSVGFVQAAALSADEISWLTYMREEEKLARDVYIYLYNMHGSTIFYNISNSEQTHMDAIKTLLGRYGITDPAEEKGAGEFTNPEFKILYDALIGRGDDSLVEALLVGVFIEETDIQDLEVAIGLATRRDIKKVYSNLLQGSLNHLDVFCSNLAKLGVDCESDKLIMEELSTSSSGPGPAPNSGDGISDGSGWEVPPKGANSGPGPAPNSGDGIPDGSGWEVPPKGVK